MRQSGDTTERWRESYGRVRKDPFKDVQTTNVARLNLLGVGALHRELRILDVGCGDGNLYHSLTGMGFSSVWGFEYQPELIRKHPRPERVAAGSATHIPFSSASFDAAIVMDVLHHLTPEQLPLCLDEMRRVLKPGGAAFVCEPASTVFRKILTLLLMSPLSGLTTFSRDKRTMVEQEQATLIPWLEEERRVAERIQTGGFRLEFFKRAWLHHYGRFRRIGD